MIIAQVICHADQPTSESAPYGNIRVCIIIIVLKQLSDSPPPQISAQLPVIRFKSHFFVAISGQMDGCIEAAHLACIALTQ